MTRQEALDSIQWSAQEGWNPGMFDLACMHEADNAGFLIGEIDGQKVAMISVLKFGNSFGFLGYYIVAPDQRGCGYGWKIWQAGMETLKNRNVALDGVPAQIENYKKSGFVLSHNNIRYQIKTSPSDCTPPKSNFAIVDLRKIPFPQVCKYDADFYPAPRDKLFANWIDQPQSHALGFVANGKLTAMGVIRKAYTGYRIGPLFADSKELALSLFKNLISKIPAGNDVFLDVPDANPKAVELAKELRMSPGFETSRMYTQGAPEISIDRTYGITSLEAG